VGSNSKKTGTCSLLFVIIASHPKHAAMNKYDLEYLKILIENRIEESLRLDYKAAGALGKQNDKTSEISKDVSAMANSDGGILIYGIKEDENKRHLPGEIQAIKRDEFSKEWFEQVIQDKIQPRLNGVQIFPIPIEMDGVVYVVDIPKSTTAHQADDKKYYKRFNFRSTAMHDYEIRDIFNREKNPQIDLEFSYLHGSNAINVIAFNRGNVYAKYVNVKIRLPNNIVSPLNRNKIQHKNRAEFSITNTIQEMVNPNALIATFYPARYEPILPQTRFQLIKILLNDFPFDDSPLIEWEVYCDNASPVKGTFILGDLLNS